MNIRKTKGFSNILNIKDLKKISQTKKYIISKLKEVKKNSGFLVVNKDEK